MDDKETVYPQRCSICGSARMIPEVQVVDKNESVSQDLQVRVAKKPQALLFTGQVYEPVRAWICGECGHVELFVRNPHELYEAYLIGLTNQLQGGGTG